MQPVSVARPDRIGPHRAGDDRRGVAAMEFAIIAPIMLLLIWGVWDVTRALLAWEETYHAAEAIAQAAEKMSYSTRTYNGTTTPVTALNAQQMQDAMSSIYAEMPWLELGGQTGLFQGAYQVTLSGISFNPTCAAPGPKGPACPPQVPMVLWSSYLTQGGAQLVLPAPNSPTALYRICGALVPVPQFPNDARQLKDMIDPDMVANGRNNLILIPQVVADVVYTYTPSFPLLQNFSYTFYASATFPSPVGGDNQQIVFDKQNSSANTVENCPGGNPYNG